MQHVKTAALLLAVLRLHQNQFGIIPGYNRCGQIVVAGKWLMTQDLHSQSYHLVALSRIKHGSLQHSLSYQLKSAMLTCQTVYTHKTTFVLQAMLTGYFIGTISHAVVLRKHIIEVLCLGQYSFHHLRTALLLPVARLGSHNLQIGVGIQSINKTAMAVDGRRRIVKTTYLYDTSFSFQALGDIIANQFTQQIVVTTDKSSILLRLRLTVDKNHRNALLLCSFEGRRNGIHLIGRNDEQTDTLVDKVIDLRQLTVIVVIGRSQTHLYRVVEILGCLQLAVQFLSPSIHRALRNADNILLGLVATRAKKQAA